MSVIVILAVLSSALATVSTTFYLVFLLWATKVKQSTYTSERETYKYIAVPTEDQLRGFHEALQDSTAKPIGVQPNSSKRLNIETFILPPNSAVPYNSAFEVSASPGACQTQVISTYEYDEEKMPRRRTNGNLIHSFKETISKTFRGSVADYLPPQLRTTNTFAAQSGEYLALGEYEAIKPELTFSIFYDTASKELHITIIGASNLPVSEWFEGTKSTQYYQVKVRVEPWETKWRATRHVCGSREPVFGETFIVPGLVHHKLREFIVHFVVVDFEEYQHRWAVVGEVTMSLVEFRANQLMKVTKKLYQTLNL